MSTGLRQVKSIKERQENCDHPVKKVTAMLDGKLVCGLCMKEMGKV